MTYTSSAKNKCKTCYPALKSPYVNSGEGLTCFLSIHLDLSVLLRLMDSADESPCQFLVS